MELRYETRDSKGKEIVKMVKVKEYPVEAIEYTCPICHESKQERLCYQKKGQSIKLKAEAPLLVALFLISQILIYGLISLATI